MEVNIIIQFVNNVTKYLTLGFDFQQSVQYETAEIPCRPTHPNVSMSLTLQGRGPVHIDNKYITYSPKVRPE